MRRCLLYLMLSILWCSACAPKQEGDNTNSSESPVLGAEEVDKNKKSAPKDEEPIPTLVPIIEDPLVDEPQVLIPMAGIYGAGGLYGGGGGGGGDNCPANPDKRHPGVCGCDIPDSDTDNDGIPDCVDNCPFDINQNQLNIDSDTLGAACDCDDNNANVGAVPMGATAFYVDPSAGNDGNTCLTLATACQSIAGALAKADDGDAILLSAATFLEGNLTISDDVLILGKSARTTIVDASSLSNPKRGFTIEASSTATICGVTITGGFESSGVGGGGIHNSGILTLSSVNISDNLAQGLVGATGAAGVPNVVGIGGAGGVGGSGSDGFGGGIYNAGTIPAISNSTISSNVVAGGTGGAGGMGGTGITQGPGGAGGLGGNANGGGIYNAASAIISSIVNSTISGNNANQSLGGPGGVGLPPGAPGLQGTSFGGAISNALLGQISVSNSTITSNQVAGIGALGGGVNNLGTFSINHTIIGNQTTGADCNGVITDTAPNLDSDGTCGNATTSLTINLQTLQNNGGPTDTHGLGANSSAIDAGDPTCGVAFDQRGVPRPPVDGGTNCDIGSFEIPL